jgi:hypothetical protein
MKQIHVHAADVSGRIAESARRLEALYKRAEHQRDTSTSPRERAEAAHLCEKLNESGGTLRFGGLA